MASLIVMDCKLLFQSIALTCTMYILFFQQVVEKKQPEERVGVVVKCDGKYQVSYC